MTLRPEYDEDHDEGAARSRHRSQYPADVVRLPDSSSRYWKYDAANFRQALRSKVLIEDEGDTLEALAGERLTIRQAKDAYGGSHWLWTGAHETDGRAVLRLHRKKRPVKRALWTLYRGGQPDTRRVILTTCCREGCVNPLHAELVKRGSWLPSGRRSH